MTVLECEAKALLRQQGIPVPLGIVVSSVADVAHIADSLGERVVAKAQVPSGKRLQAGGVRFARDGEEANAVAGELLGQKILGVDVRHVLIEEWVSTTAELFLGFTYDDYGRTPVMLASQSGGTDVEASRQMIKECFSPQHGPSDGLATALAAQLGVPEKLERSLAALIQRIARCFLQWDALLLEINPLILTKESNWLVGDVHLEIDDDAMSRHPELQPQLALSKSVTNRHSDFEKKAAEIDSADHRGVAGRLIPFDGDLGLLIGGGGASLTIMDAIFDAGLKPANYCEIGGNPSVWKVKELTKLILSQPKVKSLAVIMNVVNNTRADLIARGVIQGVVECGRKPEEAIRVFRVPGSWEEESVEILRHYGVNYLGREVALDQVVAEIPCQS